MMRPPWTRQSLSNCQVRSLIPLMGFCYMLQYMDKLALSQATMFGLQEDLVRRNFLPVQAYRF